MGTAGRGRHRHVRLHVRGDPADRHARVIPNAVLGRVSAVFLTGEAAATLTGAVAGPFLAQAAQFTGVATAASLVTLSAAALTWLIVPPMAAIPTAFPGSRETAMPPGIIDWVTSTDLDRLARTAYEAHRSANPGSLPPWEDVTEQEQKAWRAAVSAVTSTGDATLADAGPAPSMVIQAGDETRVFHTEFTAGRQGTLIVNDDHASPAITPSSSPLMASGTSRTSARPTAPGSTGAASSPPSG